MIEEPSSSGDVTAWVSRRSRMSSRSRLKRGSSM